MEKKAVLFSKEKKRQSGARIASADLAQGTTFHGNGGSWESNSGQRKNETGSERGAKPDLGPSERQVHPRPPNHGTAMKKFYLVALGLRVPPYIYIIFFKILIFSQVVAVLTFVRGAEAAGGFQ